MRKLNRKYNWLVTGCLGFIGKNLTKYLIENNQKVVGVDKRYDSEDLNYLKIDKKKKLFKFYKSDLMDYNFCSKITKNIDFVLHQAAMSSIQECQENITEAYQMNVFSFINILKASEINCVKKFVYASSSSIYKSTLKLVNENATIKPISDYGNTKLINEIIAENSFKKIKKIGLRYFNIYGIGQKLKKNGAVIPTWIDSILNGKKIIIKGKNVLRDFCYVDDVIQANINSCLVEQDKNHLVLNIASGKKTYLEKLLRIIEIKVDKKSKIVKKPLNINEIPCSIANINLAKKKIKFKPKFNLDKGIDRLVNYIRRNKEKIKYV